MNLYEVQEQAQPDVTLQVFHRRLKIPIKIYLNTVKDFVDPWEENSYQFFISKYLEEIKDQGIVGMVRQEHDEKFVFLDAAVRYPILNQT